MSRPSSPKAARPTLSEVAALAGTSVPTVSKVLAGGSDVSSVTRARVMEAIERIGYQPRGRKSLAPATPGLLDFVLSDVHGSWANEALVGVEKVATEVGQDVVITIARSDGAWVQRLLRRRSFGAIISLVDPTSAQLNLLHAGGIPVVLIDPMSRPPGTVASVGVTNWAGGRSAAEHLVALGHRRFGIIGGVDAHLYSRARIDGFRSALPEDAGTQVAYGDWRRPDAERAAHQLLRARQRPTAIFACSDTMAIGAYDAAAKLDLSIPGDLSIVGFDDVPEAAWASPPLTTVRQPIAELGASATRMLLRIQRTSQPPPREELATGLVVRASTAPAP